jgi:hypothetical protein
MRVFLFILVAGLLWCYTPNYAHVKAPPSVPYTEYVQLDVPVIPIVPQKASYKMPYCNNKLYAKHYCKVLSSKVSPQYLPRYNLLRA